MFRDRASDNPPDENPVFNVITLLYLCPNINTLKGQYFPAELYEALPRLHREGHLQHLERFDPPKCTNAKATAYYHTALLDFKGTLKEMGILDGVYELYTDGCLIPPASLKLFPCVEYVVLEELSRIHLYQLRDYIANCGPNVKRIDITIADIEPGPLPVEYNDESEVYPRENVQDLGIFTESPLSSDELAFIMRTFPSPKRVRLEVYMNEEQNVSRQHELEQLVQFFNYASLIPQFACQCLWFGVSDGLDVLPHLVNAIRVKELMIYTTREGDVPGITIDFERIGSPGNSFATNTTTPFLVTIHMHSNDTQSTLVSALKNLKSKSITSITIGPEHAYKASLLQKIDQQAIDYIIGNYSGIQDLTFEGIEFPTLVNGSEMIQQAKHLARLSLEKCTITEFYFARLSCQFQQIDCFEYISDWIDVDGDAIINKKIKIHLPCTTLHTIYLSMRYTASPYIVKICANSDCIVLKATRTKEEGMVLEEYDEAEIVSDDSFEITIYCASLNQIDFENTVYELL